MTEAPPFFMLPIPMVQEHPYPPGAKLSRASGNSRVYWEIEEGLRQCVGAIGLKKCSDVR